MIIYSFQFFQLKNIQQQQQIMLSFSGKGSLCDIIYGAGQARGTALLQFW